MTKKIEKELLEIAKRASYAVEMREDLETRNLDSEDFLDIPVWAIKEMLEKAYQLGKETK